MTASFPSQQDIFPITTEVPADGAIRIAGHDLNKLADDVGDGFRRKPEMSSCGCPA